MSTRAIVIGCGGVAGGAWTSAMLAAYHELSGHNPGDADILIGTSAGSVLASLLGGGISTQQLVDAQRREVVEYGRCRWVHDRATGGAFPPLPGWKPSGLRLPLLGLKGRVSALTAVSGLLPTGTQSLSAMGQLMDSLSRDQHPDNGWVAHPNTWVIAADAGTGKRMPFGRAGAVPASLSQAVRASYAVPGWCPPVTIGHRVYMDGGIVSPTSADLLMNYDVEEVIIIPPMVSQRKPPANNWLERGERLLRKVMTRRVNWEVEQLQAQGKRVIRLEPTAEDVEAFGYNMMDPRRRRHVFETAMKTSPAVVKKALAAA